MNTKSTQWHQDSPFESSAHSHKDWLQSVERLLGDASFDDVLLAETEDKVKIDPIYPQLKGAPFYTRGDHQWLIPQTYQSGPHEQINATLLADIAEGVNAVQLTLSGNDARCNTVTQLEAILSNVHPQMLHTSVTPNTNNLLSGALLLAYYQRQKIAPSEVRCALNIDPIGALATHGTAPDMHMLTQVLEYCSSNFPNVTALCVNTEAYHRAGSTDAQELACLLATTVQYLHAANATDAQSVFKSCRFRITIGSDYFNSIAKLRAARELLSQVAQHCGANYATITIDAVGSERSLSTLDDSVNILRNTTQLAAAIAGNANSFFGFAYDSLTETSVKASRLARNTHHVLIEESGLLNIHDPARGAGYIETLTEELCSAAWPVFQQIESQGGMQQALSTGFIQQQFQAARKQRQSLLSHAETALVGVTEFANINEEITGQQPTPTHTSITLNDALPSFTALVGALSEGENITTFEAKAEIAMEPLPALRDASAFEQLRVRSEKYRLTHNSRPTVSVLTLGPLKEHSARLSYCRNFFAIAGIECTVTESGAQDNIVVLCGSDKRYLSDATDTCKQVKTDHLWLAGKSNKAFAEGTVSENIFIGCDRLELLDKALTILGAPQ